MIYCSGNSKSTVKIFSPLLTIITEGSVNIGQVESNQIYNHNTTAAMNKTYTSPILSVSLSPPNQIYYQTIGNTAPAPCSIPTISGNSLVSNFDSAYSDNSGICSYQVTFKSGILINGKFFPSNDGRFSIACDDDCPEGSNKCIIPEYPGYCCVPCKEIGDRLKNLANKVGR